MRQMRRSLFVFTLGGRFWWHRITVNPLKRVWRLISFTFRFVFCKVTPFQCHHCGETFYAPSEEEMEIMMENHLYESHREEWEKLPARALKHD